jgi:hypothetical protein
MNIEVSASDLVTRETDDRGRITLGAKYAGKQVTVAVVEVAEEE